jgi:hypothetical protein
MAHPQTPPTFNAVTTGSDEYSVELNDANVGTLAWKSSRYNGSKTITAVLNEYTKGIDVSVGRGAAVQKYSRNIYLGNNIVGMDGGGEDDLLFNFPAFSYATTLKYFTVNGDNSISNDTVESKPNDFNARRGFYRAFYEDFKEGTSCNIILNDVSIKTNLQNSYPIYFNGGQLQKVFSFTTIKGTGFAVEIEIPYTPLGNLISFTGGGGSNLSLGGSLRFYNANVINKFYTGSFSALTPEGKPPTVKAFNEFIENALLYRDNSTYIGDKRLFTSFCTQSGTPAVPSIGNEFETIRTITTGSISSSMGVLRTENLAELSTTELKSKNSSDTQCQLTFKKKFVLNQGYNPSGSASTTVSPPIFDTGTFMFSKLEDAVPSLLLNLPKNEHIPDGVGANGFVIIPDNLHPHIKKNLTHFLAKAGVPLGVDTIPALDNTFEKLS